MRENHSVAVEPEPVSVQVVERVGLVSFSFQFFTCLAAVFAEEVSDFFFAPTAHAQRNIKIDLFMDGEIVGTAIALVTQNAPARA